jgi:hypothetical protein
MNLRTALLCFFLLVVTGCASTSFTRLSLSPVTQTAYEKTQIYPPLGVEAKAELGVPMIKTFLVAEMPAYELIAQFRHITNYRDNLRMAIDVPSGILELVSSDSNGGKFFQSPSGITISYETNQQFANPETFKGGIHIANNGAMSVLWFWEEDKLANLSSIANFPAKLIMSERAPRVALFQRELVYSGSTQSTLSLLYREFKDSLARPAFTQDLKYDVAKGSVIGFNGARFEIIEAGNTSIKYRVLTPLM